MTHLLVTNDFPPKVGGIQAYLWELWRRLDPDDFAVLTASSSPDQEAFEPRQGVAGLASSGCPRRSWRPRRDSFAASARAQTRVGRQPGGDRSGFSLGRDRTAARDPVRGGAPRCGGGRARKTARSARAGRPTSCVAAAWPSPPAAIRPPRPAERCTTRHAAGVGIPPGVDLERFVAADPHGRAEARARTSACRSAGPWW